MDCKLLGKTNLSGKYIKYTIFACPLREWEVSIGWHLPPFILVQMNMFPLTCKKSIFVTDNSLQGGVLLRKVCFNKYGQGVLHVCVPCAIVVFVAFGRLV